MGQKVHPKGIRLGISAEYDSVWYADPKDYAKNLQEDFKMRTYIKKALGFAAISRIVIQRTTKSAKIIVHTARPGVIIGKKGQDIEILRRRISQLVGISVHISLVEIRRPELEAVLVAENISRQLEKRVMFRRAMKRAVQGALRFNAEGIKVCVSGRLGGAEIARKEWYREGRVPLHTFRALINYGTAEAKTTYGVIGVKVWIFKGLFVEKKKPLILDQVDDIN